MTQEEKIELIERERDAWQCDADDHKKRGCIAHYEHEQAMANALTEAMNALRFGWVRMCKLPNEKPDTDLVVVDKYGDKDLVDVEYALRHRADMEYEYYIPLPPRPESIGAEPAKVPGVDA